MGYFRRLGAVKLPQVAQPSLRELATAPVGASRSAFLRASSFTISGEACFRRRTRLSVILVVGQTTKEKAIASPSLVRQTAHVPKSQAHLGRRLLATLPLPLPHPHESCDFASQPAYHPQTPL